MKRISLPILIALILTCIGIFIIIYFSINKSFNDGSGVIDPDLASNFGSFIGGILGPIFSLAAMFFIYETIIIQKQIFQIQQFETKFFDLIRFHRENVAQMVHRIPWSEKEKYYEGSRVFIEIKSQFEKLFAIVKPIVEEYHKIENNDTEREAIGICYLLLFIGVSKNTRSALQEALDDDGYDTILTQNIIDRVREQKTAYDRNTVYFGGHQVRLAHYFIHLFQTVKYVDNVSFLSQKQKYDFVKILRGQITKHEFAIFFVNSLSSYGHKWESEPNSYISKYKLLKHMPSKFIKGIDNDKYYQTIVTDKDNVLRFLFAILNRNIELILKITRSIK